MDQFRRAANFYAQAFDAQSQAADAQQFLQKPGVENVGYATDLASQPTGGPVPPKFGAFGAYKEDDGRVEDMKRFMLRKSLSKQNGSNGIEFRAGGGAPTQSMS